jgi:hypothetical protein
MGEISEGVVNAIRFNVFRERNQKNTSVIRDSSSFIVFPAY